MYSIKNKTALVTGANRGIGKSIVKKFLNEGADKVYAAARNIESLNALKSEVETPDKIVPILIDLNQPETITNAAEIAKDVDVVVNNAGILDVANPFTENAVDSLKKQMDVNVYGLMHMAQAFAPVLKANGGGVLVQLNSIVSMKSFADMATYCSSKAASYSITQALRDMLKEQGTKVISVHPGPIATDMANDAGFTEMAEPADLVPQAIISALETDEFHAFPDTMAKQIGGAYQGFATNIVDANLMEA